ncbi:MULTISPECIES: hypothetical protein [Serratia]|uniref:hypothetical protein n=1 Tax=Serratia TaxID=613 RepID=UPI0013DAB17C|nr:MULTISPECIES: hypothetical protein [Serratia]MBH2655714.1 hypothetical protein [Serratia ureilytica]HBC5194971.1 hypothetical protein [Serratia marcescens]
METFKYAKSANSRKGTPKEPSVSTELEMEQNNSTVMAFERYDKNNGLRGLLMPPYRGGVLVITMLTLIILTTIKISEEKLKIHLIYHRGRWAAQEFLSAESSSK